MRHYIGDETFCFTYGDGLSDVDIGALTRFHAAHRKLATVTVVRPPGRFGAVRLEGDVVAGVQEKPEGDGGWINGGFFVLSPRVIDYIEDDTNSTWELEPLARLAREGNLRAFVHSGFWQPMDTLREKNLLEALWESGKAPWKIW